MSPIGQPRQIEEVADRVERLRFPQVRPLDERLQRTIDRSVQHLLSSQASEGYWRGELEADTTLESDYILYLYVLGQRDRVAKLATYIRRRQLADGGWNIYEGGPAELNATVKAYVALRLAGDPADAPHLINARLRVLALGGLEHTNSFTRFYLALIGSIDWDMVPAVPPELVAVPEWFYVNIYNMSAWTRAIVVPLTILYARKPLWRLTADLRVDELFCDPARKTAAFEWDSTLFTWRNVFLAIDRAAKLYERLPWKPFRERALRQATAWMLEHLDRTAGLAAIYPAMMNSIFALLATGRAADDPVTAAQIAELARFEIEDSDTLRLQPCVSPVWDTAIVMVALQEAGLAPDHPALVKAAGWLLDRQILGPGDWQVRNRHVAAGGWAFEFRNEHYPDVDDTAFVLMALQSVAYPDRPRWHEAIWRGLAWIVNMQNRDGGWGAFDRDNDCAILTQIPFADHNAMIDPSTADVTARVVECLGRFGWPASDPIIARAIEFLRGEQTADGAWFGRWGVNYVYGTSGVLRALEALGTSALEYGHRALVWLKSIQNPDGGFGESCASYDDAGLKGVGVSTPSQTAWGLIGLLAAGAADDPAVSRAVAYLVERQASDGSWDERATTGTGFPRVFYLKYDLYRNSFPLYALARYRNVVQSKPTSASSRGVPYPVSSRHDSLVCRCDSR
jgi:squalene-hopene/tetraprenyl-beta-curcumene cyclase